jgi:hypothetical protein
MRFLSIRFLTACTPPSEQKARIQVFKLGRLHLLQLGQRRQLRQPSSVSQLSTGSNIHGPRNAPQPLIGSNCQPNKLLAHDVSVHAVFSMATCAVTAGIKSGATTAINLGILKKIVVQL